MITIYKLFDPKTGSYIDIFDKEELIKTIAEKAFEFFLHHTHNSPYTVVTIDDDGVTTWKSAEGEDMDPLLGYDPTLIQLATDHVDKAVNATKDAHGKNDLKVFK